MSRRIEQLTSDIERGVRDVLARGLHDPRVSGLITVTKVRVLPDMSRALIDISVLPEEKQELTLHGIIAAASHIRRQVSDQVRARTLPDFVFRLDTRLKKEAAVLKDIEKIREQRIAAGLSPDGDTSQSEVSDEEGMLSGDESAADQSHDGNESADVPPQAEKRQGGWGNPGSSPPTT